MSFSANGLNGTRNKWLDFGGDLDHLDPGCQMCFSETEICLILKNKIAAADIL